MIQSQNLALRERLVVALKVFHQTKLFAFDTMISYMNVEFNGK